MSELIKQAHKILDGKSTRLEDEEQEDMAKEIAKLGFKIGFARAYANGPSLARELLKRVERLEAQLDEVRKVVAKH